jgi:Zn-dependent M28 family amino/carboxypeptidase
MVGWGEQVPGRVIDSATVEVSVHRRARDEYTSNVVAYLEGSDPELKDEYVLFGAHHDHVGVRNGEVMNGADDNGSGTVAMLEIAQALIRERPRRSVILVWHTGEEKGLWGARWFVSHSPVPVEQISAELNMDMISRNDPDHLYVIGSDRLSTELDVVLREVNDRTTRLNLDYLYNDPTHPEQFFFRSDQFPFIQYGIPAMWFFSGTHPDYHRPTDTIEKIDYAKMERVTRLVYLVGMAIGNRDGMLKLNVHPEITTRGAHNLNVEWR